MARKKQVSPQIVRPRINLLVIILTLSFILGLALLWLAKDSMWAYTTAYGGFDFCPEFSNVSSEISGCLKSTFSQMESNRQNALFFAVFGGVFTALPIGFLMAMLMRTSKS